MGALLLITLFITIEMMTLGSCGVITSEAGSIILASISSTTLPPIGDGAETRTATIQSVATHSSATPPPAPPSSLSTATPSPAIMRRLTSADRDNKLMALLASRRRDALSKSRWRPQQSSESARPTIIKQGSQQPSSNTRPIDASVTPLYKLDISTTSENVIKVRRMNLDDIRTLNANSIADELLDTEESSNVNGVYVPNSRNSFDINSTKDHAIVGPSKHNYMQNDIKVSTIERFSSTDSTPHKPAHHFRDLRARPSTEPTSSVEQGELILYSNFGQKLSGLSRTNQVNTTPKKVYQGPSTMKQKLIQQNDHETRIPQETAPPRILATARNKYRGSRVHKNQTPRNIVAHNRRASINGASRSDSLDTNRTLVPVNTNLPSAAVNLSGKIKLLPTASSLLLDSPTQLSYVQIIPENVTSDRNISVIIKSLASTTISSDVGTEYDTATDMIVNEMLQPTEEYSTHLLITVPDDPTTIKPSVEPPVVFTHIDPPAYLPMAPYEETKNLIIFLDPPNNPEAAENVTEKTSTTVQVPQLTSVVEDDNVTDIVHQGTTTAISITSTSTAATSTSSRSFTRTTVSSSVRSTVYPNPRNVYEPIPFTPGTEAATTHPIQPAATSTNAPIQSDTNKFNGTNTYFDLSSFFPNFTKMSSNIPSLMDIAAILSTNSSTKKPIVVVDGVILQRNNDVTIEMHRMNMATYVLAGLGVFPIIIIILYFIKTVLNRKQTKMDGEFERQVPEVQSVSPVVIVEHGKIGSSEESYMTEASFNRHNLRFKNLLGEGNFGQVWKAEADDLDGHYGSTRIVAVKTERCASGNGGLREEAEIMRKLGSHCNVVTILGACVDNQPHLLIMEFAMRGRLLSLLRTVRSANKNVPMMTNNQDVRSLAPLSPRRLTGFALDIASGMEYIADKKIVHRDLAARNVLLDHNGVCKICDFGMSIDLEKSKPTQPQTRKSDIVRQHSSPDTKFRFDFHCRLPGYDRKEEAVSKRPALPIRWMAPEALQYHIFSVETDIWAFGIVLWEIASLGCTPYPNLSGREVVRNVPNGARPDIPCECRPELYDLMTRCWSKDSRQRPSFTTARHELSRALCQWEVDDTASSEYFDVSGFNEDLELGMVYFNSRISEFECEI